MSFIFNRWVRGGDFYGRAVLMRTLSDRDAKPTWILGNRRVGKTSFLRQVEWLCNEGQWEGAVPLYWDLQGAGDMDGLKDGFLEALEDAEELTERLGLDIDALEDASFSEIINKFRRRAKSMEETLLLLIDECEELVDVTAEDPAILATFRKLNHTRGISLIMAGSMRLMDLDESSSRTSPFLPDFLPPLLLGPFQQEESVALLTDKGLDHEKAAEIHHLTFGNPHLVQVIGEHYQRLGDMKAALAELKRDKVLYYFYNSNFNCLPVIFRDWWRAGEAWTRIGAMDPNDPNFPYVVQSALARLDQSGSVEPSPLLRIAEEAITPEKPQAAVPAKGTGDQTRIKSSGKTAGHLEFGLFKALQRRANPLGVIPRDFFDYGELSVIEEAQDPPTLKMMAGMDDPDEKLHQVLDGASPEYVQGRDTTERTLVYLAGLYLYRTWFGHSLFREFSDPWERAGAILDRDVTISPEDLKESGLSPGTAMCLLRALKVDPSQRYATLEQFVGDLKAV